MWITSGCQADWMCLLANTSDGPPHRNKSLLCLPMKLPGNKKGVFVSVCEGACGHQLAEAKQVRVWPVPGWVTAWELQVCCLQFRDATKAGCKCNKLYGEMAVVPKIGGLEHLLL